jgi:arginyl-tRNA synthetase
MIKEKINNLILEALKNLDIETKDFTLEHPADIKNGDYSANIAMVLAKNLKSNPKELAEKIKIELDKNLPKEIEKVTVAGAGFINFYLSREFFTNATKEILKQKENWGKSDTLKGKKIMVEYTDPNPFKPFHIGHLMTNAIGESVARIMEYSGAKTIRANYQGDVGPHVAKAIYGMQKMGPPLDENAPSSVLASYIGECYARGADLYENDENAKAEIDIINKKVYDRSDEEINKIYDWGRKVTLDAFEELYEILGTKFDYYFFESKMAPIGEKIVRDNIGKIFEESDGAVVFHAEKHDPKLHTRVFITSRSIPLYETKEVGLMMTKFEKENPDLSIIVTAIEQGEYMKVVQKAVSLIHPDYERRMKHLTHGMMKFASGKMSSRKGNVITGESLIRDSMSTVLEKMNDREISEDEKKKIANIVGVASVKYSILRSTLTSDIVYDFEKSISFEGDSGPYLQYTAVRANSILKKAEPEGLCAGFRDVPTEVSNLEHLLYQFPEIVVRAHEALEPHHIATYLTELASAFNAFYANTQIVNKSDPYAPYRVALVEAFHQTMKNGLYLLGIKTPEKM